MWRRSCPKMDEKPDADPLQFSASNQPSAMTAGTPPRDATAPTDVSTGKLVVVLSGAYRSLAPTACDGEGSSIT